MSAHQGPVDLTVRRRRLLSKAGKVPAPRRRRGPPQVARSRAAPRSAQAASAASVAAPLVEPDAFDITLSAVLALVRNNTEGRAGLRANAGAPKAAAGAVPPPDLCRRAVAQEAGEARNDMLIECMPVANGTRGDANVEGESSGEEGRERGEGGTESSAEGAAASGPSDW